MTKRQAKTSHVDVKEEKKKKKKGKKERKRDIRRFLGLWTYLLSILVPLEAHKAKASGFAAVVSHDTDTHSVTWREKVTLVLFTCIVRIQIILR